MPEQIRKVNVFGHLNPDTDSICAAIAYANLKNTVEQTDIYVPRRAGTLNRETAYVLEHFGFAEPELITSVRPQIKDTEIQKMPGIDAETSLYAAWDIMQKSKTDTLCITDANNELQGLIAVKDIANANMDVFDSGVVSSSQTTLGNIVETLNGELKLGNPADRITKGDVRVGTSPEMMEETLEEGDIVLATNRYETQQFAVSGGASCLVVCCSAHVSKQVMASAERHGCAVILTPYNTYEAARIISMSIPVRAKMLSENILKMSVNTTVDEARKTMAKTRHRYFPVIAEDGTYAGLTSPASLLSARKKHVILVDHNERTQAVEGIDHAEIMEIIDHHRIGSIETSSPALFRNMPVGCTCTILYSMYREQGVEIPAGIAGLMLSAILSDTLCFRSPTCTIYDKDAAEALAAICGEEIEPYADSMFEAGADLTGRTAEEVFHSDFKVFSSGKARFGVGQGSYMTENSRLAAEELVGPYLGEAAGLEDVPLMFYLFTDVKSTSSDILYFGHGADRVISAAFGVEAKDGKAYLPGVVSRKKQVTPAIMTVLQNLEDA